MPKLTLIFMSALICTTIARPGQAPEPSLNPLDLTELKIFETVLVQKARQHLAVPTLPDREQQIAELDGLIKDTKTNNCASIIVAAILTHKTRALATLLSPLLDNKAFRITFLRFLDMPFGFKVKQITSPNALARDWSYKKKPLTIALHWSNWAALAMILGAFPETNDFINWNELTEGKTPLHHAIEHKWPKNVQFVLDHGASVHTQDAHGRTPLHTVAALPDSQETWKIAEILLKHGALEDIDARDNNRDTPLHLAALAHNGPLAQRLLAASTAAINMVNLDGNSPLHLAAFSGGVETARTLLVHGADFCWMHFRNSAGSTPLHLAITTNLAMVQLLFEYGAQEEIHTQGSSGFTPLHVAVANKLLDIVAFLLEHGAASDILVANKKGATPLAQAKHPKYGNKEIAQLLRARLPTDPLVFQDSPAHTALLVPPRVPFTQTINYRMARFDPLPEDSRRFSEQNILEK